MALLYISKVSFDSLKSGLLNKHINREYYHIEAVIEEQGEEVVVEDHHIVETCLMSLTAHLVRIFMKIWYVY